MTLHVDPALAPHWNSTDHDGEIAVMVTSTAPPDVLTETLRDLQTTLVADPGPEDMRIIDVAPVPHGVGLRLGDGPDLDTLFHPLRDRLAEAGVDATVRLHQEHVPVLPGHQKIPFLQARLALRAEPHSNRWTLAQSTIKDVIESGTEWVSGQPGRLTGYTGVWWPAANPAEAADALIARACGPWSADDAWLTATDGHQFRSMLITPWMGYVDFSTGTPPTHADLSALIDLIRRLADLASYAYVRTADQTAMINLSWARALGTPNDLIREPDQERVEQSAPLPIAGVQLARVPTGAALPAERWTVTPIGELSLILARDLDGWLTNSADLQQAQADLSVLTG